MHIDLALSVSRLSYHSFCCHKTYSINDFRKLNMQYYLVELLLYPDQLSFSSRYYYMPLNKLFVAIKRTIGGYILIILAKLCYILQLEALYPDVYKNVHEYGIRYCKGVSGKSL
jgi:hypothetical protein